MKIIVDADTTDEAVNVYEKIKDIFGKFIKSEMKGRKMSAEYELILVNEDGDRLIFKNCLSSGFLGAGCRGTIKVLKDAGFAVTEDLIKNNISFKLEK
ncbi:UNVERIFIED_ORG: hypothetical protein B2H98_06945 [Clostridium botulinum]